MPENSLRKIYVDGKKIAVEDINAVALEKAEIVLADFAEGSDETPATDANQIFGLSGEPDFLSVAQSRAVVFFQLHRICSNQKTPFPVQLIRLLSELLNKKVAPCLSFSGCETTVVDANQWDLPLCSLFTILTQGNGTAVYHGEQISFKLACEKAQIQIPQLRFSKNQVSAFCQGSTSAIALSALIAVNAKNIVSISDAVAALSCEAFQASTTPFDPKYHDVGRPHRGEITAASNLRLLLENSKLVKNDFVEGEMDPTGFRCIPQFHGSARENIENAVKVINVEANCSEDGSIGFYHSQPIQSAISAVSNAVKAILSGSDSRIKALYNKVKEAKMEDVLLDMSNKISSLSLSSIDRFGHLNISVALQCYGLFTSLLNCLNAELLYVMVALDKKEKEVKARFSKSDSKGLELAAKAQEEEDAKLASMSEAKRAKILKKRAEKAAKKKKDEAKKGAKDELKLGVGTLEIRQWLLGNVVAVSGDEIKDVSLCPKVNGTFNLFVEDLLLRLNSGGQRRKPKIAKGAQDFLPQQMHLREKIFNKIRSVFKQHGGVEIETPVFELKETLTGKYGEDSKLIYDLADQGGELLALRYDLTVPFARFMALHNPGNIKRYHIARVYRRDQPQMARGRFREFYQCDFDIAGSYGSMLADAEVLKIGIQIIKQFPQLGSFKVKLSHRRLLDAILSICGVPSDKFRTTCSAIDKLDKESWENVRSEMIDDKGILPEVADKIQQFVTKVGSPLELHSELLSSNIFGNNLDARAAMEEMEKLFTFLKAMDVLEHVSFDLSLARGLDYYTGLIYEFVLTDPSVGVGSIAAGGRYDNLVGMFSAKGQQIPCVGVSIGIERIFGLLQAHAEKENQLKKPTVQVLVASANACLLVERLQLCELIWSANISAEILPVEKPSFKKQLQHALEVGIPYMVVIGEDEVKQNTVKIKNMSTKEEKEIPRDQLVSELFKEGCQNTSAISL